MYKLTLSLAIPRTGVAAVAAVFAGLMMLTGCGGALAADARPVWSFDTGG